MKKLLPILTLVAGLIAGIGITALFSNGSPSSTGSADTGSATAWTCSMHPQIQQPKPGKCPICAMDLIPLSEAGQSQTGPRELAITEAAKKLAQIETVPVRRQFVEAEIRLVGKIAFDETRTRTLAARFPARIDRLYVDYTGIEVHKGDHLAQVYSPELLTAQRELLSAIKFGSNVETARDKLRLWDLSEERIQAIEERGTPSDRMDIDAPIGGIVITKHVNEGDYVQTGEPLFEIADLNTVWVELDAYESDMPWLRYGQPVNFEAEAVPGRKFEGTVAFIAPTMDPKSRTVDVRVNADNPEQRLKPGMFVNATVFPTVAAEGKVIAPQLKGKWISPMHPEIIRDEPGPCPVCGMDLVKAEELGYAVVQNEAPPLIVPTSAVLRTGKRSVVYVEVPGRDLPTYQGREIVIGPRASDFYIVEEGLREGDQVVAQGNFKIDSALQIVAKPSMMNPQEGVEPHDHGAMPVYESPPVFREMLQPVFSAYLEIQEALASDSLEKAKTSAQDLLTSLDKVDMALVKGEAHTAWMGFLTSSRGSASMLAEAENIETARTAFRPLSHTLIDVAQSFGIDPGTNAVEAHCPMAFDNEGANWLQIGQEIQNPYFGSKMLKCGDVVSTIGEQVTRHEAPDGFRKQLGQLVQTYFGLANNLANDDFAKAHKEVGKLQEQLNDIGMSGLNEEAHTAWMELQKTIEESLQKMQSAEEIEALRAPFEPLSMALMDAVQSFQPTGLENVYELHCPMAFDFKGASWLQPNEEVLNPYFGAEMLECGSVKRAIAP